MGGGTEAFPDLGEHCGHPDCRLLDFLPFTCDGCRSSYCLNHRSYEAHNCPKPGRESRRVVVCQACSASIEVTGKDEGALFERHEKSGECDPSKRKKSICPVRRCRQVLTFSNTNTCKTCRVKVCLGHRFPADHSCKGRPAASVETTRWNERFMAALDIRSGAKDCGKEKEKEKKGHISPKSSPSIKVVFLLLLSINPSHEFEVIRFVRNHLKAFGYLSAYNTSVDDTYDDALESALRTYQSFYRLNVTGRVEPDTLRNMIQPRCGVPDLPSMDPAHDVAPEYAFMKGNHTWPPSKRTLTYWFNTPVIVPIDALRTVLSNAFSSWSAVSSFNFQEAPTAKRPDLVIGFFTRDHGDGLPFDGPRGILAHSSAPTDGRFHFDADEQWSTSPSHDQFDLESVALHEIGHLLGLGHSADESAVMFATFDSGKTKRVLQLDDLDGIDALYHDG